MSTAMKIMENQLTQRTPFSYSGSRSQLDRDRNRTFVFWGMNSVSLLLAFNSGGPGASIGGIVCATGGPTGGCSKNQEPCP
jgi:hypothetical protein